MEAKDKHLVRNVYSDHWCHYISNYTIFRLCLVPYKFYLTNPFEETFLSVSDDPWDPGKFSDPEKYAVRWTPIVMYLGRTERKSYKFLAGDQIGYWHDDRIVELKEIEAGSIIDPLAPINFSF